MATLKEGTNNKWSLLFYAPLQKHKFKRLKERIYKLRVLSLKEIWFLGRNFEVRKLTLIDWWGLSEYWKIWKWKIRSLGIYWIYFLESENGHSSKSQKLLLLCICYAMTMHYYYVFLCICIYVLLHTCVGIVIIIMYLQVKPIW